MRRSTAIAIGIAFSAAFSTAQDAAPPPSVILISIDTLRADHLSAYGYRKIHTPNIDSFAHPGTLFAHVNSQIPLTLPSHTSLLTSTYPFANGIEENAEVVPANAITLASVLQTHGYRTAAFVGSNMLDRRFGLDKGFEEYDSPFGASPDRPANPYSVRVRRDGAIVLRAANQWLSNHRDQRVFLFIHLFDLHTPYKLTPARRSHEPETTGYDAELAYVDGILGRFRRTLEQNGWWRKSLVVLLSDHGESLGDHGELSHGYFIYESTLHVPLIVHWPDGPSNYPQTIARPGGLIDVAPTILDALSFHLPPSFDGMSLLKAKAPNAVYGESVYARDSFHWAALRSVRMGHWKYIEAPRPELFDLDSDPTEQLNVARSNSAQAATLRLELNRLMARHTPRPGSPAPARDSSSETKNALESLGYLSGGRGVSAIDRGPDPKDRLAEYQLFDDALDALYSQRLDAAIRGFLRVLMLDPKNLPARGTLGEAYLRADRPDRAIREWTTALATDPKYTPAAQALGELYMGRKDWAKARPYLQQALASAPGDATLRFELSLVESNLGSVR